ncbi:mitochondrial inner membrane protein required for protein import [Tulasnella sp. 417]|nr:mitochondrial inner membrane protein required for protein import [Tulasnella sp. 417]
MASLLVSRSLRFAATRASPAVRCLATQAPPPPPGGPASSSKGKTPLDAAEATNATEPPPATESSAGPTKAISLDFDPASDPLKGGRTGARSAKDSLSSIERRRKVMTRVTLALGVFGLAAGWVYAGREWEAGEEELKRDAELAGMEDSRVGRANARIGDLLDYFNKPLSKEILPQPQHKPYTLCLSLDDLLITSTWDRQNGWRTAKRPGVDYFLAYLSQFFEIVIFTSQQSYTAMPVIEQLDPYGQFIVYRLCREYTRNIRGKIVKDLAYLNRDLSKVILIDTHPEHISAQPENSILLPKWTGESRDRGLVGLIPFLESLGILQPQDVRPVLKAYEGKDIPTAYAQVEADHKKRFIEAWEKKHEGKRATSGSVGRVSFGSLFGGPSGAAADPNQPPPTYLDLKRKEAQEYYRREQQWLKENEEELKKLIEADKQAQMAEMGGTLLGALAGIKPPEAEQKPGETQASAPGTAAAAPASAAKQ